MVSRHSLDFELTDPSLMYRFHPAVKWRKAFPNQQRVSEEVTNLWLWYRLQNKTRFNTPVQPVNKNYEDKWVINDEGLSYQTFDGVIAAIGTCGEPKMPYINR
jgi:cation diffusion facilitator CzcD-associated flavoprotein CzcO